MEIIKKDRRRLKKNKRRLGKSRDNKKIIKNRAVKTVKIGKNNKKSQRQIIEQNDRCPTPIVDGGGVKKRIKLIAYT